MMEHIDMASARQCRHPGCSRPWTMDIERRDGYATFMCEEHGDQLLETVPEDELKSVTGSWGLGESPEVQRLVAEFAATDLHGRARRKARRKAQRQARRR